MNSQQQQPPSHNLDNTTAVDNNNNLNNHNILNTSNDKRDSAYWSIGSTGDASKRTYFVALYRTLQRSPISRSSFL